MTRKEGKDLRDKMKVFIGRNPGVTVREVMEKFKMSSPSVAFHHMKRIHSVCEHCGGSGRKPE